MISALLAISMLPQQATLTLAADAYLDRKLPSVNTGREPLLLGGIDKAILVRFPDLGLKIGMGMRVKSASLVMGIARPGEPILASVSRVLTPWFEGGNTSNDPKASPGAVTWAEAIAGKNSVKWERDGASGGNDAQAIAGAQTKFENDILTVSGLETAVQQMIDNPQENHGFRLAFSNAVAFFSADSLADGPRLVLTIEDAGRSEMPDIRVLSCEPSPASGTTRWTVAIENRGADAPSIDVAAKTSTGDAVERKFAEPLASGGKKTLSIDVPIKGADLPMHVNVLTVRVTGGAGDVNPSDNGLTVYPGGLAVRFTGLDAASAQVIIADFNERVFPFSKFGSAPTGCIERLRLASANETAVEVDTAGKDPVTELLFAITGLPRNLAAPYQDEPPLVAGIKAAGYMRTAGQVGLLPDTRDDVMIPKDLPIPDRTVQTNSFGEIPMNSWGMLSRSEVNILNSQVGKPRTLPWGRIPSMVFFRVFTPDGIPPTGAKLEVYQLVGGAFGGAPVFAADIGRDGSALMESRPAPTSGKANPFGDLAKDGSNGWLLAVVRLNGAVQSTWVPVWQLWDEFARGNEAIGFIELKLRPSAGPLDTTQNLATGSLVTDAKGRFPAELNVLVDGKNDTGVSLADEKERYWIDLDLGRDRQIGQIQLVFDGPVWKQFRIVTYKTAQSVSDAIVWAEEANGPTNPDATKTDDGKTVLSYSARSVRSRFVHIVPLSREAVKLVEVRVIPVKG
jgi:hypothetical protein